jgi:hypothetical protein
MYNEQTNRHLINSYYTVLYLLLLPVSTLTCHPQGAAKLCKLVHAVLVVFCKKLSHLFFRISNMVKLS